MKSLGHVMRENEWLTYRGYGGDEALRQQLSENEDAFDRAVDWVGRYMRRQQAMNQSRSSYELKHICEKMVGRYISNGAMIAAFLAHEYEWARIRTSWNVEFNVSECAAAVTSSISNGNPPTGFVYFIQAGEQNLFKIGRTSGLPDDRLASLQTASPFPLSLYKHVGTDIPKMLEKDLHQQFKPYRVSGEWFAITPEMIRDALP